MSERSIARMRARSRRLGRRPCFVCGKFARITQAHHVCPLSEFSDAIDTGKKFSIVWLCPNHHVMLHEWRKCNGWSEEIASMMSHAETDRFVELYNLEWHEKHTLAPKGGQ
jgi:hypothetical protein